MTADLFWFFILFYSFQILYNKHILFSYQKTKEFKRISTFKKNTFSIPKAESKIKHHLLQEAFLGFPVKNDGFPIPHVRVAWGSGQVPADQCSSSDRTNQDRSQGCPGQGLQGDHSGEQQALAQHAQRKRRRRKRNLMLVFTVLELKPDWIATPTVLATTGLGERLRDPQGEHKGEVAGMGAGWGSYSCPAPVSAPQRGCSRLRLCNKYECAAGTRRLM